VIIPPVTPEAPFRVIDPALVFSRIVLAEMLKPWSTVRLAPAKSVSDFVPRSRLLVMPMPGALLATLMSPTVVTETLLGSPSR
jgi:hypothetical protein